MTIVSNENVFLPIWLRYYSRFFGPEDIYVLDNESTDEVITQGGFVRIPVAHDTVDHVWMVEALENLQHRLLDRYDMVLVTDVDEIVAPHPRVGTLGDYLDRFDEEWVNCLGYELLHMKDREPPFDPGQPILEQRAYWFFNDGYDKAALATVPMDWRPGLHGRSDHHFNLDPDLRLIHLHRMDFDVCLERHRVRSQKPWADVTPSGAGQHTTASPRSRRLSGGSTRTAASRTCKSRRSQFRTSGEACFELDGTRRTD